MAEEIFWAIFIIGYALPMAFYKDGFIFTAQVMAILTTLFVIAYWTWRFISWRMWAKRNHHLMKF